MRVAVIGSGYVGLVAAACFAELGNNVICVDSDARKIAALEAGDCPIHEEYLPELLAAHRGSRLHFTGCLRHAVESSDIIFIAVGTPAAASGDADLSYVEAVAREIGSALNGPKIIVEKSTVPVYTCEWIKRVIAMGSRASLNVDVVSNPEFLREGTAVTDFLYPDRIVIGADREESISVLRELYSPLLSGAYYGRGDAIPRPQGSSSLPAALITTAKSAELIKHASNAFLATKISFANALAAVCDSVGSDVRHVTEGLGLDRRIGSHFLHAGLGYGGSCFPKDVQAFRAVARECGYEFTLLDEVVRINKDQQQRFLKKIRNALWNVRNKRLAVLGLSYKGGTDDIRESPALRVVKELVDEGAQIVAYDPAAIERAREYLGATPHVEYATDAYLACRGADAVLILTDWAEFRELEFDRLRSEVRQPLIIDGRNLFLPHVPAAYGFEYVSVGRPTSHPTSSYADNECGAVAVRRSG